MVEIGGDHRLGHLDLHELGECVVQRRARTLAGIAQLALGQRFTQVGRPRFDRVELADVLVDPFVGELGQLAMLHRLHLDDEVRFVLGALRCGDELDGVTGRRADEVIVEVVGDPTLPDLVGPVLGVQAEDLFAVAQCGHVDDHEVAGFGRTVDVAQRRVTSEFGLLRLGDVGVGHLDARQLDAQRVVTGDGDDRTHLAGRLELDRAGLFAVGDLDLGGGDQIDVVLADRSRQILGHGVAQRLFAGRAEPDAGFEHLAGHLAGTESGEVDLLRQQLERLVDVLVELRLFDFDVHLDLVVLEDFNRTLHGGRGYLCLVDSAAVNSRPADPSTRTRIGPPNPAEWNRWSTGSHTSWRRLTTANSR